MSSFFYHFYSTRHKTNGIVLLIDTSFLLSYAFLVRVEKCLSFPDRRMRDSPSRIGEAWIVRFISNTIKAFKAEINMVHKL